MLEAVIEFVLDESKWLTSALVSAGVIVAVSWPRQRRRGLSTRLNVLWAGSLLYGSMIGVMAFGHLLAVSLHAGRGTLEGSLPLLLLLGAVLWLPAWWLVLHIGSYVQDASRFGRRIVALHVAIAAALLALGPHNFPLALPAFLNVGYLFHTRRRVGWTLVGISVAFHVALLIGSFLFFFSGQTFEELQGIAE